MAGGEKSQDEAVCELDGGRVEFRLWYTEFDFRGKPEFAVLSQIRMMSVSRLYNRMGKLSNGDFKKIKAGFKKLIK